VAAVRVGGALDLINAVHHFDGVGGAEIAGFGLARPIELI
jgi:hypothetical protein